MPTPVTDFYDDANKQQLYAISKLYGTPDFVKNAEEESADSMKLIPSSSFADPIRRKFPCHTKAATWLAQAYFSASRPLYNKKEADTIQDRITKHAEFWSITGIVNGFKKSWAKIASSSFDDLPDSDYALIVMHGDEKIRRMPMPNPMCVKHAAEYLFANRIQYPYAWRKSAALRIMSKALGFDKQAEDGVKFAGAEMGLSSFSADAQEYLERACGFGCTTPQRAAEKIAQRVLMLTERHDELREKLAEMAIEVNKLETISLDDLVKIAEVVDGIDRETGLHLHYLDGVDMPEEMFFEVLEKQAAETVADHVTLTTGNSYPIESFALLPLAKIAAVLGDDVLREVTTGKEVDPIKFAALARTLPRPDALLLEKAISAAYDDGHEKSAKLMHKDMSLYDQHNFVDFLSKRGHKVDAFEKRVGKPATAAH